MCLLEVSGLSHSSSSSGRVFGIYGPEFLLSQQMIIFSPSSSKPQPLAQVSPNTCPTLVADLLQQLLVGDRCCVSNVNLLQITTAVFLLFRKMETFHRQVAPVRFKQQLRQRNQRFGSNPGHSPPLWPPPRSNASPHFMGRALRATVEMWACLLC